MSDLRCERYMIYHGKYMIYQRCYTINDGKYINYRGKYKLGDILSNEGNL